MFCMVGSADEASPSADEADPQMGSNSSNPSADPAHRLMACLPCGRQYELWGITSYRYNRFDFEPFVLVH